MNQNKKKTLIIFLTRDIIYTERKMSVVLSMSVVLCTRATFVKKNSFLFDRIVSFYTAGLHLLTFCVFKYFPYLSKDIELDLSHVI